MKLGKKSTIILYLILVFACLFSAIYNILPLGEKSTLMLIACVVLGFPIGGFFYTLIHELGHVVGGKVAGFKLYSFCVLGLELSKKAGKWKLSPSHNGKVAGYCQMFPPKSCRDIEADIAPRFIKYVRGAYVASFGFCSLLFALCMLPLAFPTLIISDVAFYIFCAFTPMFLVSLFMHGINFSILIGEPATDGNLIRGIKVGSQDSKLALTLIYLQSLLSDGARPKDLPIEMFDSFNFDTINFANCALVSSIKLTCYIDMGEIPLAHRECGYIARLPELPNVLAMPLLCEVFFVQLYYMDDFNLALNIWHKIESYVKKNQDTSTLRIMIAKQMILDSDKESAQKTFQVLQIAKQYNPQRGVSEMDEELASRMLN